MKIQVVISWVVMLFGNVVRTLTFWIILLQQGHLQCFYPTTSLHGVTIQKTKT